MSAITSSLVNDTSRAEERRNAVNKWLTIGFFLLPGMAVFLFFVIIPIAQSAYYSLFRWDGFGPITDEMFRGFENYQNLLEDRIFWMAVQHSLFLVFGSLLIQLPIALGLALLVGRGELPGRRQLRVILFVPYVFSEVITALLWLYVLNPNGMFNTLLATIPGAEPIGWLSNRDLVMGSIFLVLTWKYFGFHMILYMAGLQGIPKDLEEAARIDGATERQVLRFVTLPLLATTIRLTIFLAVLGAFQQFVVVAVLTQGGPVNASETMATYLNKYGIKTLKLGYGSAIAVTLFASTLAFSLTYQRLFMRQEKKS
jgi:raffinose/stachyose/melibiose transport system permease protein